MCQNAVIRYVLELTWRAIIIPVLWINTIMWDAVQYMIVFPITTEEQPPVPRRIVRKRSHRARTHGSWLPPLYLFANSWLVFEGTFQVNLLSYQEQCPTHPLKEAETRLLTTYVHIMELDLKVMFSTGTCVQYQSIQAKQVWSEMYPKKIVQDEIEEVVHEEEFFILFKTHLLYMTIFGVPGCERWSRHL
jgi:hypothetical protein